MKKPAVEQITADFSMLLNAHLMTYYECREDFGLDAAKASFVEYADEFSKEFSGEVDMAIPRQFRGAIAVAALTLAGAIIMSGAADG